jgi:hypothetical protein
MGKARRATALLGSVTLGAGIFTGLVVANAPAAHAFNPTTAPEVQQKILDGYAAYEFGLDASKNSNDEQPPNSYYPRGSGTCSQNISSNIKVNQNCLNVSAPDLQGRAQAENETSIAINPNNTNELLAASNDYRRGDGGCFPAYSLDKGRTWNDTALPSDFTRGANFGGVGREYWQTCGDPFVIGYDTYGNAYFGGLMFNRGTPGQPPTTNNPDSSSAVYVYRSTGNDGASWSFPGTPVVEDYDTTGASLQDKPYGTIDDNRSSPYANRIYVTWTDFAVDGSAYIYEAYSSDFGRTFSAPHVVSGDSTLCPNNYGLGTGHGNCNENQFSDPFVGPNGNLYVVYNNYNNAVSSAQDNENQFLLAESVDGGNTFLPPVKVASYYDLPDCATYQGGRDFGRACVPEKGSTTNSYYRATNYAVGAVNPTAPNQVVVTFGSYINKYSNETNGCLPDGFNPATGANLYTGVKTPGACNNKILYSISNNGGATFTGTTTDPRALATVNTASGQAGTDQFWQWMGFTKTGKLAVSYYDRQYGTDETTGSSDMSLSGTGDLTNWVVDRVTSSSMPPPTEFAGDFLGDYSGLAVNDNAYPLWTDTRNPDVFDCATTGPPDLCTASAPGAPASPLNDEDIYTAALAVPSK